MQDSSQHCHTDLAEAVLKVDRAEEEGKYLILINPLLKDIPSADAVMGIRCISPSLCSQRPAGHHVCC